jgi:hypothetical protein
VLGVFDQVANQRRPDETGTAGDEDLHYLKSSLNELLVRMKYRPALRFTHERDLV